MRKQDKIKLILCLLTVIFLFVGCRDNSQEVREEVPEAPAQTEPTEEEKEESLPLEIPVQETSEASPEPVEEKDPAPPEPSPEEPQPEEEPQAVTYVLNTNTMKFHKPTCRSAGQIKPKNRQETAESREDVVARGYSPCGNCKP